MFAKYYYPDNSGFNVRKYYNNYPPVKDGSRCQKRIDQELVFGSKIHVGPPMLVQASPARYGGPYQRHSRRHYNSEGEYEQQGTSGAYRDYNSRESGYGSSSNQENIQDPTANFQQWHSQNNKSSFQNYHRNGTLAGNGRPVLGVNSSVPNGNAGHLCKSTHSTAHSAAFSNGSQSQPITILKRTSPLPPNFVLNINTSIPPPPIVSASQSSNGTSANERYFHPISSSTQMNGGSHNSPPVELHVTNLDQSIEPADLKRILTACFSEHVSSGGAHVSVFTQSDGTVAAAVKLRSCQDAQVAISQLHRKKIGFKRISISYSHSGAPYHSPTLIRSQIISLLQEVPKYKLPLFKFREMFEMRYSTSISVSELYKMKDVCTISEESTGRTIALNPDHRDSSTPSPINRQNNSTPLLEQPYCTLHSKLSRHNSSLSSSQDDKGWAELEASALPNLKIPLVTFAEQVVSLIESHSGALPLLSFPDCYEAQFGSLVPDEAGVPLEHLATCIKGVELVLNSYAGIKYLRKCDPNLATSGMNSSLIHSQDEGSNETSPSVSPSLQGQMSLLCRELVDLLKTFPHCQMVFNKFIPAYHHHFGRQCRVADYGFTKLIDLLEAIPHVVQVMGEGSRRLITLSHRAQMRRFTSDLLRCLKSVPNKQCTLSAFPGVFARVHCRPFDPVDYGLSSLQDLLANVSENTIVTSPAPGEAEEVLVAVPKREQTSDEIERTKKFSREVVEVLSHMPHYSILFNKFIPSYHHHYGHQCRVADFGFTKLIELFESIPDVVSIEDDIEDRRITLTIKEKLAVLLEQVKSLITLRSPVTLDNLNSTFSWQFGYPLRPACYGATTLDELVKKLEPNVKVQGRDLVIHEDNLIGLKLFRIFLENSNSKILLADFINIYKKLYKTGLGLEDLSSVDDVVKVIRKNGNEFVTLTSLQLFAKDVYHLLYACEGKISLGSLESMYLKMYGTAVQCAVYGHQSLSSLLGAISSVVTIKGKHKQKILILNRSLSLVGIALPRETNNNISSNGSVGGEKFYNSGFRSRNNNEYGFKGSYSEDDALSRRRSSQGAHDTGATLDEMLPVVHLPDFKIHPDTFTCTPLTSPYKGLPSSLITAPHPSTLPLPPF